MMWIKVTIGVLTALAAGAACSDPESPPEEALSAYIARADASFEWHVTGRWAETRAEIIRLTLQSQTWRETPWKHQLFLIRPASLGNDARQGLLVLGGGRWHDSYDAEAGGAVPLGATFFVEVADRLGAIVAVVAQVPFQPSFGLTEGDLIAYSFEQYLQTGDSEWPVLLPMVKSAVRAMDASQAVAKQEWDVSLDRFTVLGGSKRGWAAWLTGAVDSRVAVVVPVAIDFLNIAEHLRHQTAVWGATSVEFEPFASLGLLDTLVADEGAGLRAIVDPYSYRARLTQPKLIVAGTNDPYFPVDSLNLYWDALPSPKYILYLPNSGHGIGDLGRFLATLNAIHRSTSSGPNLPKLEWQFEKRDGVMRLCLRAEPAPVSVTAWTAESASTDFRDSRFTAAPVSPVDDDFVFELRPVESANRAVFAEAVFGEGDQRFSLSTNVRIVGPEGQAPDGAATVDGIPGVCR